LSDLPARARCTTINGLVGSDGRIVGNPEVVLIGNIAGKFKTVGDFVAARASEF